MLVTELESSRDYTFTTRQPEQQLNVTSQLRAQIMQQKNRTLHVLDSNVGEAEIIDNRTNEK